MALDVATRRQQELKVSALKLKHVIEAATKRRESAAVDPAKRCRTLPSVLRTVEGGAWIRGQVPSGWSASVVPSSGGPALQRAT